MSGPHTKEDPKRKRPDKSNNTSSDSPVLSEKRIRKELSIDSSSSVSGDSLLFEESTPESPAAIKLDSQHQGEPPVPVNTSTPVPSSTCRLPTDSPSSSELTSVMSHPIHTDNPDPNVNQQMSLTALETMMERVLDKKTFPTEAWNSAWPDSRVRKIANCCIWPAAGKWGLEEEGWTAREGAPRRTWQYSVSQSQGHRKRPICP